VEIVPLNENSTGLYYCSFVYRDPDNRLRLIPSPSNRWNTSSIPPILHPSSAILSTDSSYVELDRDDPEVSVLIGESRITVRCSIMEMSGKASHRYKIKYYLVPWWKNSPKQEKILLGTWNVIRKDSLDSG